MLVHAFLIKYAEIALKGKNRYRFEDALVHQMEIALSKIEGDFEVKKEQGRVYVFCPENYDYDEAVDALQHVFGIVGICPVMIYEEQGFEKLAEDVVSYMKQCIRTLTEASRFGHAVQRNPIRSAPWKLAQSLADVSWMRSRRQV